MYNIMVNKILGYLKEIGRNHDIKKTEADLNCNIE